jgi:hypothetical protein
MYGPQFKTCLSSEHCLIYAKAPWDSAGSEADGNGAGGGSGGGGGIYKPGGSINDCSRAVPTQYKAPSNQGWRFGRQWLPLKSETYTQPGKHAFPAWEKKLEQRRAGVEDTRPWLPQKPPPPKLTAAAARLLGEPELQPSVREEQPAVAAAAAAAPSHLSLQNHPPAFKHSKLALQLPPELVHPDLLARKHCVGTSFHGVVGLDRDTYGMASPGLGNGWVQDQGGGGGPSTTQGHPANTGSHAKFQADDRQGQPSHWRRSVAEADAGMRRDVRENAGRSGEGISVQGIAQFQLPMAMVTTAAGPALQKESKPLHAWDMATWKDHRKGVRRNYIK